MYNILQLFLATKEETIATTIFVTILDDYRSVRIVV
jgi:hypothetical protein